MKRIKAFPVPVDVLSEAGMDLRDYFAGQALTGSLANSKLKSITTKNLANLCYDFADAMMEARKNE